MGDYLNQQVQEEHIHFIVNEILAHTDCVTSKEKLFGALGLPSDYGVDLENKYRLEGCNSYNYFKGMLSKWINLGGDTASTLELNNALRSIKWNAAADNLKEKWFDKIWSTVEQPNTSAAPRHRQNTQILRAKWWPDEKRLVNSFQQRKSGEMLYVEKLSNMLKENQDGTAVINQKVAVSGFGGVGKTTTAKWYAIDYQEKYDYILWIDCGEGSLLKSFRDLALELETSRKEVISLTRLARECFDSLENMRCLWIYDNAECYVGTEGIKDVLPKKKNFHSIITSRNCEWGSSTGYGEIPTFPLAAFELNESIAFLTQNLEQQETPFHKDDLEQLCEILGNLPLALQIAVATVNKQNLSLTAYIERIERTDHILSRKFDDYEKTINSALKISLDFIISCQYDSNQLAYRILLTFGYIQPDDIETQFLECVETCSAYDVQEAMEILEQYSLVSKKKVTKGTNTYSIHRLLQQVIRYNAKSSEIDTITKILNCDNHYEYKLAPYTFAPEDLKNKFPRVRATLIDQIQLPKLILERKFTDALQLSEIIQSTLRSPSSLYNYAVCLRKRRKFEAAVVIFKAMYDEVQVMLCSSTHIDNPMHRHIVYEDPETEVLSFLCSMCGNVDPETELLPLQNTPDKNTVGSQLFRCCLEAGSFKNAEMALKTLNHVDLWCCEELLSSVLIFLGHDLDPGLKAFPIFNIFLNRQRLFLNKFKDNQSRCSSDLQQPVITADEVTLNEFEIRIPEHTKSLEMTGFDFHHNSQLEYSRAVNLGHFVPPKMTNLRINCLSSFNVNNYFKFTSLFLTCNAVVPYTKINKIKSLELRGCNIEIDGDLYPQELLNPKKLHLEDVHFVHKGKNINKVLLNQFVNFAGANCVTVAGFSSEIFYIGSIVNHWCWEKSSKILSETIPKCVDNVEHTLEMSGNLTLESVKLCGSGIKILNWGDSNWNIGHLVLKQVRLENSQLKVRELEVNGTSLDLASIPATVEKLTLGREATLVVSNSERAQQFTLPNLKFLRVKLFSRSSYDFVGIKDFCTNVVTVMLENWKDEFAEIDFSIFPKTVKTIKLRGIEVANACTEVTPFCVDKLILYKYTIGKAIKVLTHVKPKHLVYYNPYSVSEYDLDGIIDFSRFRMDCECIFIGSLEWSNFAKSDLSSHVDKEAEYYLFENQKGIAIGEILFMEEVKC